MNLCEALKAGREQNRAITKPSWIDVYIYHGTDNLLRWSNNDDPIYFAVADLLDDNYVLAEAPYHGPLDDEEEFRSRILRPFQFSPEYFNGVGSQSSGVSGTFDSSVDSIHTQSPEGPVSSP